MHRHTRPSLAFTPARARRRPGPFVAVAVLLAGCASTADPAPGPGGGPQPRTAPEDPAIGAVRFVHGAPPHGVPGPWALAGHRIGVDAMRRLGADRGHAWGIAVTHRSPREVQFTCVLDGLAAATGASLGKLNLTHEAIDDAAALESVVVERRTGRTLTYRLTPAFRARFTDVDYADFPEAARVLAGLPDEAVFEVHEEAVALPPGARR